MEPRRNALLAEMARDAALERSDFLVRAGEQLERFMTDQAARITELGGITLIDDDPDYLAVAPAVTRVARDLPLPDLDDALPRSPSDTEALLALSDRWGLAGPLERFLQALEVAHSV